MSDKDVLLKFAEYCRVIGEISNARGEPGGAFTTQMAADFAYELSVHMAPNQTMESMVRDARSALSEAKQGSSREPS